MGIDTQTSGVLPGASGAQTGGLLRQGTDLAGTLLGLLSGSGLGTGVSTDEASAQADLQELDARAEAADILDATDAQADALRDTREQARAERNTDWGTSGLAMSGSKQLVREAARTKDDLDEEALRDQGDEQARDALDRGRAAGNLIRINGGAGTLATTLSLGSSIYTTRR
jgi:hypothetical protein